MSALQTYAKGVAESQGILHMRRLRALRWYINNCSNKELAEAVARITDMNILKALIEAGLRQPIMDIVVARADELAQRRE